MSILVQSAPSLSAPQTPYANILYTNTGTTNIATMLYVTCIADGQVPTYPYTIPMTGDDMYSVAIEKAKDIHFDDTCSIAILANGVTTPTNRNEFILFQSQITHTLNPIKINLGPGESIFVVSYQGYLSFNLTTD